MCVCVCLVLSCRRPASPAEPESVSVCVSFEPDPADLALSSVPGQEVFDPRRRRFSEDELKPQPMIKKARKVFIPNDLKVRQPLCVCVCVCVRHTERERERDRERERGSEGDKEIRETQRETRQERERERE